MQLSKRLAAVAGMVTEGSRLVDVGTDHGYLPIFLVEEKKIPSALAMDINRGPLKKAEEHITALGLEDYIETRLSDGLLAYQKGEADSLVIAGMGGNLMVKILSEGKERLSGLRELILEPQSDPDRVRLWLTLHDFVLADEDFVEEDGKYYPVLRAIPGTQVQNLSREELLYGPCLLKKGHPVLKKYLLQKMQQNEELQETLEQVKTESAGKRRKELKETGEIMERAFLAISRAEKDRKRMCPES